MKSFPVGRMEIVKRLTHLCVAILDSTKLEAEFRSHSETKDEIYANYTSWNEDYYISIVLVKKTDQGLPTQPKRKVENVKSKGEVI